MTMQQEEITSRIIGAAIEVHRVLGPGFLETVYEQALAVELRRRSIPFVRQHPVPVTYQGVEVGLHRLDIFVLDQVVVELKAVKELAPEHFAVVRSYLRACQRDLGLLLNFAKVKLDIKRVYARAGDS